MTSNNVKDLLDRVASHAPELRGVLGTELRQRIARRRRARVLGTGLFTGAGVVGLVVGLATVVNNGGAPETGQPASSSGQSGDRPAASRAHQSAGCGARIDIPPTEGPMKLTAAAPVRVSPDERGLAQIKFTLVNSSARNIDGIAAASPSVLLSRDGIVVATSGDTPGSGRIIKLIPDQAQELIAAISFKACNSSQPLEPGVYELYAILRFQDRDTDGTRIGESIDIKGGPWVAVVD